MKAIGLLIAAFLAASLNACGTQPAILPDGTSVVEGYVIYEGLGVVPAGDVVEVMLVNVSDPEILQPVTTGRIEDPEEGSVPFDLVYQVQGVQAGNAYALCARAMDASGDILWQSDEPTPVDLPTGEPVEVFVTAESGEWDRCADWVE